MSFPLLSINGATKRYGGVPALIEASITLYSGEVHALMGENGAGKSTLIKLLAGVLAPDSMQVMWRGTAVSLNSPQAAFDLGLRFIHQELNIVPQLSVAENIFLSQRYPTRGGLFVDWDRLNRAALAVLAELGVTHLSPRAMMARLRTGDQMLVKLAGAFVGAEPSAAGVYVMDEPTAALTGAEAERLFKVIERLRERGCAILYVSHRLDEIFQIAQRVTVMRDGRVVSTAMVADSTPAQLIQLMTGRELRQLYPPRRHAADTTVLLEVDQLATTAVREVSFQLRAGEIVGVAGLNGAGRTELLRALIGADRRRSGRVTLLGQPLARYSITSAWRRGLAFVPEERRTQGLILSRAISENVALPHWARFNFAGILLNRRRQRKAVSELGTAVKLKAQGVQQLVWELSGGNQQKVVFARALAGAPQVLLLDEPTRGVDVGAKYDLYDLIRRSAANGAGIVLASSDLDELIGLCDRILIMRGRHLAAVVATAGLSEAQLLALCYGEDPRQTSPQQTMEQAR